MAIDRSSQPIVRSASGVLVGVAQVRVGKASIRDAGTAANSATLIAVGKSNKAMSTANTSVCVVKPDTVYSANGASTPTLTITGSYSGKIDGTFIVRACAAATVGTVAEASSTATADRLEIFSPYGILIATKTLTTGGLALTGEVLTLDGTAAAGLTIGATFASVKVGDTWTIPVWSGAALNMPQTGICSPFSMFYDATDSIGGLKSAFFNPKIDSVKRLSSGFPSQIADSIVDSTSVELGWDGYEYTNSKLALLKQMIAKVINQGEISSISAELVMRTRGGSLVRMWVPTASFNELPNYAPENDYSSVAFKMQALKQTEFAAKPTGGDTLLDTAANLAIYNGWLAESPIYSELQY